MAAKTGHPPFQPCWERAADFLSLAQAANMASRISEHQQWRRSTTNVRIPVKQYQNELISYVVL